MNKIIAGILGLGVLVVGGFIFANIFFMSTTQNTLSDNIDQSQKSACNNTLQTMSQIMQAGEERPIPEACFTSNGEPVLSDFSGAQPGDNFTKTESGVEVAN